MATMTNCPLCGKLTDPKLDRCVHCGGPIHRGAAHTSEKHGGRSQTCPNCHALVQEGDIICVACGTNLLTGQRITEEKQAAAAASESSFRPWLIGLGIGLIILVIIILLIVLMSRDAVAQAEKMAAAGQTIQASELLKSYVARRPDNARAQFTLGKLQWMMEVTDGAAASFERAAKLDPANTDAAIYAALCYALQPDNTSQAKAAALLEPLTSRAPSFEVYYLQAQVRAAQGDIEGQIEALQQAVRLDPAQPRARLLLGVAKALGGDIAGAAGELKAADRGMPSDATVAAAQGLVATLTGSYESAVDRLRVAAESAAEFRGRALIQLGLLLLSQGKAGEAQNYFDQALTVEPGNMTARFYRALCLDARRSSREALAEFDAISRAGGPFAADAAVHAARIYLQTNEPALALEVSDRAVQLNAEGPVFHTVRGRIFARLGQVNEARESYRNAVRSDPSYAPAHLENGLLYIQTGLLAEGIQELEAYLELVDPNLPDARVQEVRGLVQQLRETLKPGTSSGATSNSITRSSGV